MAKGLYIGDSNGKARKVKKAYIGVNGVARKIKKAYIGVNGVARLMWSEGLTAPNLSSARYYLAAATVGNYALFGGGYNGNASSAGVDAFIFV